MVLRGTKTWALKNRGDIKGGGSPDRPREKCRRAGGALFYPRQVTHSSGTRQEEGGNAGKWGESRGEGEEKGE